MASTNQGGSILSFLLIGGVLAVLLIGGVYVVQQQRSSGAAAPTTQPSGNATAPAKDNDKVAVDQNKDGDTTKSQDAQKKTDEPKETAKPATTTPVAPQQTPELPKTGPAENVSAIIGLSMLTAVSVAYVQSRKRTATL